jgi:hypothetical protein
LEELAPQGKHTGPPEFYPKKLVDLLRFHLIYVTDAN